MPGQVDLTQVDDHEILYRMKDRRDLHFGWVLAIYLNPKTHQIETADLLLRTADALGTWKVDEQPYGEGVGHWKFRKPESAVQCLEVITKQWPALPPKPEIKTEEVIPMQKKPEYADPVAVHGKENFFDAGDTTSKHHHKRDAITAR
jgi:hypothetical protein